MEFCEDGGLDLTLSLLPGAPGRVRSRLKFSIPPRLGTNLGLSVSSSSSLNLPGENREAGASSDSTTNTSFSGPGLDSDGRRILVLPLFLNCLPPFSTLSSSPASSLAREFLSGRTLSRGLLILSLSCPWASPSRTTADNSRTTAARSGHPIITSHCGTNTRWTVDTGLAPRGFSDAPTSLSLAAVAATVTARLLVSLPHCA